jgi:hypothetical protein
MANKDWYEDWHKDFFLQISKQLDGARFKYEKKPVIGGLRPDFLVFGPKDERVIVELKGWDSRGGNTARAWDQVEAYEEATGADHAFLVVKGLERNFKNKGVVNPDGLVPALCELFKKTRKRKKKYGPRSSKLRGVIFAAMPFSREYDDTFFVAMVHAAKKVNAICRRVDTEEFPGDIVEKIKKMIKESIAVIVDLSESRPNVLYETGFAHALPRPTVHICSTPLSELPFDVRNWNTIEYSRGRTTALRGPLTKRLRAALKR